MPQPFSSVIENTREEILSSDLNRMQRIGSRELQNVLWYQAATQPSFPGYDFGSLYADVEFSGANLVNGSDLEATLNPATGFTVTVGLGQAYFPDLSITGDDSPYQVVRWPQTNLTFTNPDGANPRIDLIVVTPGSANSDIQSRNILLDPNARTVGAANVPKISDPSATLSIVTGTPAGSPVPPAVPSGKMALFEVWVPAAAADATHFAPVRRTWKRVSFPQSTMHGIVGGVRLNWTTVDETTTSSTIGLDPAVRYNRAIIAGEVLQWGPTPLLGGVFQDSGGANPFGAAAPATHDLPYYIYLVGGRNLPQLTPNFGAFPAAPVILVESLTSPDAFGYPTSPIATPRGNTQLALYVGIGFVVKNSTRRKPCSIAEDWVYAQTGQMTAYGTGTIKLAGFNEVTPRTLANAITSQSFASRPAISTKAKVRAMYANSVNPSALSVGYTTGSTIWAQASLVAASGFSTAQAEFFFDIAESGGGIAASADPNFATATFDVVASAYNMLVPRMAP